MYETRRVVFDVLHELNRTFEVQRIAIRGLGWEEYVTPGIAAESQAVINQQLLTEYDILIGVFGTKLGTPTANSASGTVEEIEHAIANSKSPLGNYRVQVYFRDRIESASSISIDEYKKVAEFRESLKSRGVLYRLFADDKDLQKEIRANIERPILEFMMHHGVGSSISSAKHIEAASGAAEVGTSFKSAAQEFGILDHMEKAENSLAASIASSARIAPLVNEIAEETNRQVTVFEQSVSLPATQKKAVVNDFASFLKSKAAELKREASSARESFDVFADATILAAALEKETLDTESYDKDIAAFLRGAESVLPIFAEARKAAASFIAVAQNLPRITIQFNQAKRELLEATNECLNFFDNAERRIFEITAKT
jgi:hypothetical protein